MNKFPGISVRVVRPAVVFVFLAAMLQVVSFSMSGWPTWLVSAEAGDRAIAERRIEKPVPEAGFVAGDLAVLVAAASASNTTGAIVELNTTTPASNPVQTIAIPGTGVDAFRFSGSATSTGYLATTNDGTLLAFTGANSADTTSNVNTLNPRAVGTIDGAGSIVKQTTYTGSSGNQTRSATSQNNSAWAVADQGGVYTNGAAAASPTGNFRGLKSFGGTFYIGQASSAGATIQVGTLSAVSGGTFTGLPGLTNNAAHQDFYLISSGDNGAAFDVLYVVSATSNTAGTIAKFSLVAGTWTANGTYTTTFGGFGIAAADNGSGALVYVTTGQGALTANSVIKLTDTAGYNVAITISTPSNVTLYTTAAGTIIKGVAFAPVAPATAPEINVKGNGLTITDGDITPSTVDGTDLGNVNTGNFVDQAFAIENTGTANLTLGAITFSGTNPTDFAVQTPPVSPVLPGGSTNMTIRFTPGSTGLRSAAISVVNNDSNENPYDFALQGTGVGNTAPTIVESTASPFLVLPATGPGTFSGVVGDATDPGHSLGVDFTILDAETASTALVLSAVSSNQAVVPDANLNLSGTAAARNIKITPVGTGYATITVSVSDGALASSYLINYAASVPAAGSASTHWHTGKSDASTAIAIDGNYMLIADDEDQGLRLYDRNNSGLPINVFDFTANLALTDPNPATPREVDIEASARSGNRIYWLGSHSNSSGGASRPNRSRLFATDVAGVGAGTTLTYVGRYDGLKTDLINWDNSNGHGLGAGFFGLAASAAPPTIPETPDGSGFNIEGLEFAPDGTTAYICFRAPLTDTTNRTKALVVPVTNFASLVAGNPSAGPATFGPPIQLNLDGRGIREIRRNAGNEYLIVAGSASATDAFRAYSWTGNPADQPVFRTSNMVGLHPEAIVDVPLGLLARPSAETSPEAAVNVQLVSDNGDDVFYGDGIAAKDLANNEFKKFRSDVVIVGLAPSAAGVSVSGRLLTPSGEGVKGGRVSLVSSGGEVAASISNAFGYYSFENVVPGETYIIMVASKRYVFAPRVVTVVDQVADLNLVAEP